MDKFLKIQNFKTCKLAFTKWMTDNYNVQIDNLIDINYDKELFEVMRNVKDTYIEKSGISITDLNNISLNQLQDIYIEKLNLKKEKNTSYLNRDKTLYGDRPMPTMSLPVPENTSGTRDIDTQSINAQFDLAMSSRVGINTANTDNTFLLHTIKDSSIPEDDFAKLLSTTRDNYVSTTVSSTTLIEDNKKLYEPVQNTIDNNINNVYSLYNQQELLPVVAPTTSQLTVIPEMLKSNNGIGGNGTKNYKYLTINGFDRDWKNQYNRYSFSIDFTKLPNNYKNVNLIQFTNLIIPNEIIDGKSIINQPKYVYHHDHKLAYPYILLQIDEISDMYDGFNQQVQKTFTQFVYYTSYKCPNGRGYIVLKPAQKEKKVYNAPITLQKFTISVNKPNGTLYNNSIDDYKIIKIEYLTYNSLYLMVVLDKFFDKNEVYIGDSLTISGYVVYKPAAAAATASSAVDYTDVSVFVNRVEGHEIIQIGDANDNGFYKSFYILAPGVLDQQQGKLVVNKRQVDALREYNIYNTPSINGSIMNTSLQMTLSMQIGMA